LAQKVLEVGNRGGQGSNRAFAEHAARRHCGIDARQRAAARRRAKLPVPSCRSAPNPSQVSSYLLRICDFRCQCAAQSRRVPWLSAIRQLPAEAHIATAFGLLRRQSANARTEASYHDVPAVRIERRAHIVGALVRGEENCRRRDLFDGAGAADWQLCEFPFSPSLRNSPE
jgi:hypothetical protein